MVAQENVRQIPYTVTRPVVERVEQQVPVQVCRMVTERQVRRVPVTTCRWVSEERVEQIPVRTCRMVAYEETVQVPRCVERRVPVTYTARRPRVVCYRIPLDACGNPIVTETPVMPGSAAPGEVNVQRPTPAPAPDEEDLRPRPSGIDAAPADSPDGWKAKEGAENGAADEVPDDRGGEPLQDVQRPDETPVPAPQEDVYRKTGGPRA
jgi:hypothetical protein